MPGANVSSTSRIFSAAVQRRRRWTEVMISTWAVVLVIQSVISLTLPKCETLSGQFGGNLTSSLDHLLKMARPDLLCTRRSIIGWRAPLARQAPKQREGSGRRQ